MKLVALTAQQIEQTPHDRWRWQIQREVFRWRNSPDACADCGELIGHYGGDAERDPCRLIPQDVPLEEIRPNCYVVRRHWIGDAIRAACASKGIQ